MNTMKTPQQNTTYVYFKCHISIAAMEYFLLIARENEGPNTATCDISLVLLLEGLNCDRLDSHKLFSLCNAFKT